MKDHHSRRRGFSFHLWIVVCVLLATRYVTCYNQVCPGGQDGMLDRRSMETVLSWIPEVLKNPDDICESNLGSGSFLCREEYNGNYSSICVVVWCYDPVLDTCTTLASNDGIQCGDQKWCYDGVCRYSDKAAPVRDSCPYGDSKGFSLGGLTCEQGLSRDRKWCDNDVIKEMCCGSCQTSIFNQPGCLYGDLIDGCLQEECPLMTERQLTSCCQTCGFSKETVPSTRPQPSVLPTITAGSERTVVNQTPTTQPRNQAYSTSSVRPTTTKARSTQLPSTTSPETRSTIAGTTSVTTQTSATRPETSTTALSTSTTEKKARTSLTEMPATEARKTTTEALDASTQAGTHKTEAETSTETQVVTSTTTQNETTSSTQTRTFETQQSSEQQPTSMTNSAISSTSETTSRPPETSTISPETASTAPALDSTTTSIAIATTSDNAVGGFDTQDASQNVVAIGTGVGVGTLVVIAIIVISVYVIKKRVTTSRGVQPQRGSRGDDNQSVGGDSTTNLTANMMEGSSFWYPSYLTTHTME